ncbi:unnamed protein product [Closterium sp. NIES-53]
MAYGAYTGAACTSAPNHTITRLNNQPCSAASSPPTAFPRHTALPLALPSSPPRHYTRRVPRRDLHRVSLSGSRSGIVRSRSDVPRNGRISLSAPRNSRRLEFRATGSSCRHWRFADALVTSAVARGKALPIRAEDARAERLGGNAEKDPRGDAEEGAGGALQRDMFPPGFLFGTATAAYQVEGAAREGGRGASIWDVFAHTPGKTHNGDTGDVACDQYHRYEEDVALMRHLGFSAYRFSISWSRILPTGRLPVNQEGVDYYHRLIHCLLRNGITPCVTLFHWDLPQALEEEFGGFRGAQIVHLKDARLPHPGISHCRDPLLGPATGDGGGWRIQRGGHCMSGRECVSRDAVTDGFNGASAATSVDADSWSVILPPFSSLCSHPSTPFPLSKSQTHLIVRELPTVGSHTAMDIHVSVFNKCVPIGLCLDYARLCFSLFGNQVPYWITFNEPYTFATKGYAVGDFAPGRCSDRQCCAEGDGAVEPYVVVHHMLLAHAAAVDCYRREFQPQQGGQIGISVDSEWAEPFSQHPDDVAAADRRMQFNLGWLLHPIFFGAYPPAMSHYVGPRLPSFSPLQAALLKGSVDFLGLNHYTSRYIEHADPSEGGYNKLTDARGGGDKGRLWSYFDDQHVTVHVESDGCVIGQQAASPWLYEVPWGFQKLLVHITSTYGAPPIYITENGLDEEDDPSLPLHLATSDPHRIRYYHAYLSHLLASIRQGADVRGYMAWSWMDNFEWQMGYSRRFGLVHVDRTRWLKRTPKASALWWQRLLSGMPVHES